MNLNVAIAILLTVMIPPYVSFSLRRRLLLHLLIIQSKHFYQPLIQLWISNYAQRRKLHNNLLIFYQKFHLLFFQGNVPNVQHFFGEFRCCTLGATGVNCFRLPNFRIFFAELFCQMVAFRNVFFAEWFFAEWENCGLLLRNDLHSSPTHFNSNIDVTVEQTFKMTVILVHRWDSSRKATGFQFSFDGQHLSFIIWLDHVLFTKMDSEWFQSMVKNLQISHFKYFSRQNYQNAKRCWNDWRIRKMETPGVSPFK